MWKIVRKLNTDENIEIIGNYFILISSLLFLMGSLFTLFSYIDYKLTNTEADARVIAPIEVNTSKKYFNLEVIYYNDWLEDSVQTSVSILSRDKYKYANLYHCRLRYYFLFPYDIYLKNYGEPNFGQIILLLLTSAVLVWVIFDSLSNRLKWFSKNHYDH